LPTTITFFVTTCIPASWWSWRGGC